MAFVKNWLHCVWGTKNRHPYLIENIKDETINHILYNAKSKNIYIDSINGYKEHVHCLISLNPDKSLSDVIQLIKGESSYWINKQKITRFKFEWAVEYFGVSVSESQLNNVRHYIKNQEEHHRKETWEDEYNKLITEYGFDRFPG
jgi:REP element-mobilizing transposase RayT